MISSVKRIILGRPIDSDSQEKVLLSKKLALPIFASDALSSCAYAPDEMLVVLSMAGLAGIAFSWKVGLMVALVFVTVILSYTQTVHAYPSGGGDFEVVQKNLSERFSLIVGSALMVDYILTIVVSISSGIEHLSSQIDFVHHHKVSICLIALFLLTIVNLRGTCESGKFFAVPVYLFIFLIFLMAIVGFFRVNILHNVAMAESAQYTLMPSPQFKTGLTGFIGFFLILRAFASGSAALTGVEAISNGVPVFKKPKSKNAATTLVVLGCIAVFMVMSIISLAHALGVKYVDNPHTQLLSNGSPLPEHFIQIPVIEQISRSIFSFAPFLEVILSFATTAILMLAANTAFGGFPVLGSILSKNNLMPKQLSKRGDKLAFSNGIYVLVLLATLLIVIFKADVTKIIQLYIVGVFISFTLSQTGMVIHWTKILKKGKIQSKERLKIKRSRAINLFGLCLTAVVLIVILATKLLKGAWITLVAICLFSLVMTIIKKHYMKVESETKLNDSFASKSRVLPSRVHAIVLVPKISKPAMRAIAYARVASPSFLEIVTVAVDKKSYDNIYDQWKKLDLDVPLRVLASPYREITRPVLNYIKRIKTRSPRDLVAVYIPEYVVGKWWEQFLHNQSALRIKTRLHFMTNVVISSVPWQLNSFIQNKNFTKK